MARNSTWITPQETVENFASIAGWNQKYASARMEAVYLQKEWPLIESWQTPGFYFIKDGTIVASVIGWPGDQQLETLKDAFRRIGL